VTAPLYLDSSALLKLVIAEPETRALIEFLRNQPERTSSTIARVEVTRAARRAGGLEAVARARRVLAAVVSLHLTDAIVETAAQLTSDVGRSLDAIQLASALSLMPNLAGVVVYDRRLADAARRAGLQVWAPA
jgi:uncharacterized protein